MDETDYEALAEAYVCYEGLVEDASLQDRRGLTKSQCAIIWALAAMDGMSVGTLAKHVAVSKEQATRMVNTLAERGLVARTRDQGNGRIVNVSLTNKGNDELARRIRERNASMGKMLAPLSEDDRRRLVESARTSAQILKRALCGPQCAAPIPAPRPESSSPESRPSPPGCPHSCVPPDAPRE